MGHIIYKKYIQWTCQEIILELQAKKCWFFTKKASTKDFKCIYIYAFLLKITFNWYLWPTEGTKFFIKLYINCTSRLVNKNTRLHEYQFVYPKVTWARKFQCICLYLSSNMTIRPLTPRKNKYYTERILMGLHVIRLEYFLLNGNPGTIPNPYSCFRSQSHFAISETFHYPYRVILWSLRHFNVPQESFCYLWDTSVSP